MKPNYLAVLDAVHWLHLEFRKAGLTINAFRYPMSETAVQWKREFNGVPEGYPVPWTWPYASNAYMHKYMEDRAAKELAEKEALK